MAANYWQSTQHIHWETSKTELAEARAKLEKEEEALIQRYPLPERRLVNFYLQQQLARLGRRFNIRQPVLATAQVFLRRFYSKVEIRRTNPYLLLATAFYVALKIEECPQHIRVIVTEARNLWPDLGQADTVRMGECEFQLISEIDGQLIVHHPYRSLNEVQTTLALSHEEMSLAWSVVNDHYSTDLVLTQPPHLIAVTAVVIAVVIRPSQGSLQGTTPAKLAHTLHGQSRGVLLQAAQSKDQKLVGWLASSEVDIEALVDCVQEMISLYVAWESYSDKECKEQIGKFIKDQGLGLDK